MWDFLCSILPLEARQKIAEFNLFTDGTSNILAYTSPIKEGDATDNTRFSISIDYYDVYDENGARRDWSKLTYTILHEYGHVLLEDETQIDLSKGTGTHDPATFVEGSFRKNFYDAFWSGLGDTGVGDYEANPTRYVSRYGGQLLPRGHRRHLRCLCAGRCAPGGTRWLRRSCASSGPTRT